LTEYFRGHLPGPVEPASGPPLIVLFAGALAHILDHQALRIYEDELIVGNLSSQRIGAPIHPDFGGLLLLPELRQLSSRAVNPLRTTPEQIDRLEQDVFPYWLDRSVLACAPRFASDPDLTDTLLRGRDFVLTQFAGISHVTPDYPAVLAKGFAGILAEVEAARPRADSPSQAAFHDAAAIAARAAIRFARRWSAHCEREAARTADRQRGAELLELAGILARVPAYPAETFHEALQSLFLTHVIVHQESFQHGVSFGRIDQYLAPYYERDLAAGRLTRRRAIELLGCFLGKAAEQLPLFNGMATEYFSGLSSASGLTLGGTDAEGNDAANELSYLVLLAYDQMRLRQPNLHLRVHSESPPALLETAHAVVKRGGGMPGFFNDERILPALRRLGVSVEDARNYSVVGCVEWGVPGKSFPAAGAGFLSLAAVLEDVLHRPLETIGTMPALLAAFEQRLAQVIAAAVAGNNAIERTHAHVRPTPFLSLLLEGCVASGRDVTAGGAVYNWTGLQGVGLADIADSLAGIEQVVFQHQRHTLAELVAALDADFVGYEGLRQRLLNKVERYGQDGGCAEAHARRIAEMYCRLVRGWSNPRGGPYAPGFWSMTTHVGFGRRVGALPSGRRAGEPLSDGISPENGADRRGPTASLMAAARAGGPWVANGLALNEKLDPQLVAGHGGTALMVDLTRGYFAAGGMQVQYNVLDPRVLIDAKQHPERYRDLVVRISGYSAYFNDLTEAMKDDIIARTLHGAAMPACQVTTAVR
jgi:formate C-acetyltransferase